jgi:hypothetical protein
MFPLRAHPGPSRNLAQFLGDSCYVGHGGTSEISPIHGTEYVYSPCPGDMEKYSELYRVLLLPRLKQRGSGAFAKKLPDPIRSHSMI